MKVHFSPDGWNEFLYWTEHDPNTHQRVLALIADARRSPFAGLGKPEPLRGDLSGWWSRRIIGGHRLIYRVAGTVGLDQRIEVIQCRHHY